MRGGWWVQAVAHLTSWGEESSSRLLSLASVVLLCWSWSDREGSAMWIGESDASLRSAFYFKTREWLAGSWPLRRDKYKTRTRSRDSRWKPPGKRRVCRVDTSDSSKQPNNQTTKQPPWRTSRISRPSVGRDCSTFPSVRSLLLLPTPPLPSPPPQWSFCHRRVR